MRTYIYSKQEEVERLQYYVYKDIIPTEDSYFNITDDGKIFLTQTAKSDTTLTDIVIPYKINNIIVTTIGTDGFSYCSDHVNIIIPNSVTTIDSDAFYGCYSLASIEIPNSVTTIGSDAFHNCYSLASIEISNSVTSIQRGAFYACGSLQNVEIPNSVTYIGLSAFGYCHDLRTIIIPDSVTSIGEFAFDECSEDLTIICSQGSIADTYAKENGIKVKYNVVSLDKLSYKTFANSETLVLNHNQEARSDETIIELILSVQDNISDTYHSTFSFTTGDSITIAYPVTPIIWKGDDCDNEGLFNPEPNTGYEISIKRLGNRTVTEDGVQTILPNLVARVGVY